MSTVLRSSWGPSAKTFFKKICSKYKDIKNWKTEYCNTVDSINPGMESNPGHLFRYHTNEPPKYVYILSLQFEWMNRY